MLDARQLSYGVASVFFRLRVEGSNARHVMELSVHARVSVDGEKATFDTIHSITEQESQTSVQKLERQNVSR